MRTLIAGTLGGIVGGALALAASSWNARSGQARTLAEAPAAPSSPASAVPPVTEMPPAPATAASEAAAIAAEAAAPAPDPSPAPYGPPASETIMAADAVRPAEFARPPIASGTADDGAPRAVDSVDPAPPAVPAIAPKFAAAAEALRNFRLVVPGTAAPVAASTPAAVPSVAPALPGTGAAVPAAAPARPVFARTSTLPRTPAGQRAAPQNMLPDVDASALIRASDAIDRLSRRVRGGNVG